jgi:hypothetical protein
MTEEQTTIKLEELVFMPTGRADIFDLNPERLGGFKKSVKDIFTGEGHSDILIDNYRLNERGIWVKINNEKITFDEIGNIDGNENYGITLKFKTSSPTVYLEFSVPIYAAQEPGFSFLRRRFRHTPTEPRMGLYISQAYTENPPNRWATGREELIFV